MDGKDLRVLSIVALDVVEADVCETWPPGRDEGRLSASLPALPLLLFSAICWYAAFTFLQAHATPNAKAPTATAITRGTGTDVRRGAVESTTLT